MNGRSIHNEIKIKINLMKLDFKNNKEKKYVGKERSEAFTK